MEAGSRISPWFWLSAAALIILLGFVLVPSVPTHFFSDDYTLLVESQSLPLTQADDQLHRPLRNIAFKLSEHALGLAPAPYRLAVLVTYLLFLAGTGWLLGCMHLREPWAVLVGVAFVAFFPRNHSSLFWFAASQDIVVACLAVFSCALFLRYRELGKLAMLVASALGYAIALGFKETAIVLPGLVFVLDCLTRRPKISELRAFGFWRPYLAFVTVAFAYTAYFLVDSGAQSLTGHKTQGYYNAGGPMVILRAFLRVITNILLPFAHSFSLRQVTALRAALLVAIVLAAGLGSYKAGLARFPAAGLSWMLIAGAPVAVFAHFTIADHYLMLPMVGAAIAIAGLAEAVCEKRPKWTAPVVALLFIYCGFGAARLIEYRIEASQAAQFFDNCVRSVLTASPPVAPGSEIYVIGLMHHAKHYPVAANGFRGGLESSGFPIASKLLYNYDEDFDQERALRARLLACPVADASPDRVLLLNTDGTPAVDRTGPCAVNVLHADKTTRPDAWSTSPKEAVAPR